MTPIAVPLGVVFDCADPIRLAGFWRELVGGEIDDRTTSPTWIGLGDVPHWRNIGFQKVAEGKKVKNRVHVDLDVDDLDAAVARAAALGATVVGSVVEEPTNWFQVMADIEGNEFCFILRKGRS